jgi:hypothetical protein
MCVYSKEKYLAYFCFLLTFFCLLGPVGAWAQAAATGSVQGTVTDPTNAAVAAATVTLTDTATNAVRAAVKNEAGRYIFPGVPPGIYDVSIAKAGFRTTKFVKQEVTVGATLNLDAKLELGSQVETVEVQAATGAELQTMNATIGVPRSLPLRRSKRASLPRPGSATLE